ncbi:MAG: Orotidine 5'-phosphate decarboxylase [Myxococcota bacterium]|nr:Orotidine 5'-phosphate decarboxylase [Myxococcota bacterium]
MKLKRPRKTELIVALDVADLTRARELIVELKDIVDFFKVGAGLFTADGVQAVEVIRNEGGRVFLDLKYHDIPNTVMVSVRNAVRLGAEFITVHCGGGKDMMVAAIDGLARGKLDRDEVRAKPVPHSSRFLSVRQIVAAAASEPRDPAILGVTVLTSMLDKDLREVGLNDPVHMQVLRLARLGMEAGLSAFVCSPEELPLLRKELGEEIVLVTPGVRLDDVSADDQKRTMRAADAARLGADYIVVGRPITKADKPREVAQRLIGELNTHARG